ncbi:MAG TPA: nucleotidyltransferase domain-containing protein [Polyangiaceae bacterium]
MIPPDVLIRVEAALDALAGLDALWIFGSEASGRATGRSDVDLAALFRARPEVGALLRTRDSLADIVGRSIDLVDLERASPVLAMQVLRHGNLITERDRAHRIRFAAGVPGRYEDVIIFRRPAERLLRARLAHGRA